MLPKGPYTVATKTREHTLQGSKVVECPCCKAPIGKPCTALTGGPLINMHKERKTKAVA